MNGGRAEDTPTTPPPAFGAEAPGGKGSANEGHANGDRPERLGTPTRGGVLSGEQNPVTHPGVRLRPTPFTSATGPRSQQASPPRAGCPPRPPHRGARGRVKVTCGYSDMFTRRQRTPRVSRGDAHGNAAPRSESRNHREEHVGSRRPRMRLDREGRPGAGAPRVREEPVRLREDQAEGLGSTVKCVARENAHNRPGLAAQRSECQP